ncbi:P-loop containing nucleoside triphosphate hydrolase [Pseudocohnilembus persalinus]|uniref:p-loop containing nucleoside triphosphate hydrolase n=1 Tax=Pseudocohnilembus persalinus TaxID=266149 RepID=A0A0V0QE00_PSEPJ|nr:P-loop containing nucleoside triphosphate hydrolase [Pseudocohnilembus persalinus]|eukprot:KRX00439.1 P-loop containing nucleoside triphosphate hydrolase [Pseudocohnilembus persalinus]
MKNDIQKYEKNPHLYLDAIKQLLNEFEKLGKPLEFINIQKQLEEDKNQKNQKQQKNGFTNLMIGEVGSGKSTTNNAILKILSNQEKQYFTAKKSTKSVTKQPERVTFENFSLIDSPGTNDPQEKMNDYQILEQINQFLIEKNVLIKKQEMVEKDQLQKEDQKEKIKEKQQIDENLEIQEIPSGLTSITQCLMVDQSGRIKNSAIQSMINILLNFTYIYPDFNFQQAPRLNVIFTNYRPAKIINNNQDNSQNNNNNNNNNNIQHNQSQSGANRLGFLASAFGYSQNQNNNNIPLEEMIQTYKNLIIQESQKMLDGNSFSQKIKEVLENCLPNNNFYTFKLSEQQHQGFRKFDKRQLKKFISDNENFNKRFVISKPDNTYFESLKNSIQVQEKIVNNLKQLTQLIAFNLSQGIENINTYISQEKLKKNEIQEMDLISYHQAENFIQALSQINKNIENFPWAYSKCNIESIQLLEEKLKNFNHYIQKIQYQEITQIYKYQQQKKLELLNQDKASIEEKLNQAQQKMKNFENSKELSEKQIKQMREKYEKQIQQLKKESLQIQQKIEKQQSQKIENSIQQQQKLIENLVKIQQNQMNQQIKNQQILNQHLKNQNIPQHKKIQPQFSIPYLQQVVLDGSTSATKSFLVTIGVAAAGLIKKKYF